MSSIIYLKIFRAKQEVHIKKLLTKGRSVIQAKAFEFGSHGSQGGNVANNTSTIKVSLFKVFQ